MNTNGKLNLSSVIKNQNVSLSSIRKAELKPIDAKRMVKNII